MGAPEPGPSLVLTGLRAAASPAGTGAPLRGSDLGRIDVQEPAAIAVMDGRIAAIGAPGDVLGEHAGLEQVDCRGAVAIPGLVDCHTHPAFGGDRAGEFDLRAQGADYERIHASGGGIRSTVAATRALGAAGLAEETARHLAWMAANGTTTAEGKSGYGLDHDTELASLAAVAGPHPIATVPTYLGAHSVPPEFGSADEYLDFALAEVLPEAARVAEHADVFLERGAFSAEQAERYLRAAMEHGLVARLHGDQFTESGAIPLAVELGARSVDHLEATGPGGVAAIAASEVAAVLLPVAALYLRRSQPPARALVDHGAIVALATDFNPGSAFCDSLPVVMTLACTALGMTPGEALAACTVNAAWVLGRAERVGRLAPGFDADIVLLDAPDWRHVAYHLAGRDIAAVYARGRRVAGR
ncbi:MAG TPA: imidazolonepropionase [Gaiellales bacterium]|nr:imidazolonepropionase [Gaiellales bacterium]